MKAVCTSIVAIAIVASAAFPAMAKPKSTSHSSAQAITASVGAGCHKCEVNGDHDLAGGLGFTAASSKTSGKGDAYAGGYYDASGMITYKHDDLKSVGGSASGSVNTAAWAR